MAKKIKTATKPKKLKSIKGYVKLLKVFPYAGNPIYLRQIGEKYFEYSLIFDNELYSSYVIFEPREGKKKIGKKDIDGICVIILSGAVATIDSLIIKKKEEEANKINQEITNSKSEEVVN